MRRLIRYLLIATAALSVLTGYPGIQTKGRQVEAATDKGNTFVFKEASDFTLKIPAVWKNKYVVRNSKGKKHGSYVAFYAKKCYEQTEEGWLFSIMRYKDDSYMDIPSYDLIGKWGNYNYVAVYPTDVQTMGADKAARKQYLNLVKYTEVVTESIQPVKKTDKRKGIFRTSEFSLVLPDDWKGNYVVKKSGAKKADFYVAFYAKKCYTQDKEGFLFLIERYEDESYQELPSYELVGKWNGYNYVAVYPTDVQFVPGTKAAKQYMKLNRSTEKVARSIRP